MIHGLLIEGTDYAGKTTVCKLLGARLTAAGLPARLGHCYVFDMPILDHFLAEAKRTPDLLEIDWFYSANILLDLARCHRGLPSGFLVQDRHWLSQVGRNRFFHPDVSGLPSQLIWDEHLPFAFNYYLTSTPKAKRERALLRPSKSVRDTYLRDNPERHQAYDEYLVSLLPAEERWTVVDTSELRPEQVAERIATDVLRRLHAEAPAQVRPVVAR
ncbi:hypothetical protein HUA74_21775 [Myxococcus sp. CA051A]|uniref:hypothetical protein n=1 Tax=unclassified Myxococcus TaxID=2648731 RepID=UPI00157B91FF|nr:MULTISPECIES: hypothetical protein [unclassified Myxococcus]NTX51176.1 hypothetical protein [Myxococcus sp. CA039A]NTX63284.1 hypothetical protein [Myxococcus sp. CA051A]